MDLFGKENSPQQFDKLGQIVSSLALIESERDRLTWVLGVRIDKQHN